MAVPNKTTIGLHPELKQALKQTAKRHNLFAEELVAHSLALFVERMEGDKETAQQLRKDAAQRRAEATAARQVNGEKARAVLAFKRAAARHIEVKDGSED